MSICAVDFLVCTILCTKRKTNKRDTTKHHGACRIEIRPHVAILGSGLVTLRMVYMHIYLYTL